MTVASPEKPISRDFSYGPTDWARERAVLGFVLDQHPRRLTLSELSREVGSGLRESAIRRAVDNLVAASFLLREGTDLVPAPAVVAFDQPASTNF
jgi:hypothetical protein